MKRCPKCKSLVIIKYLHPDFEKHRRYLYDKEYRLELPKDEIEKIEREIGDESKNIRWFFCTECLFKVEDDGMDNRLRR